MNVLLFWSGGKDSAMAFTKLKNEGHNIIALVTTIDRESNRVRYHGISEELLIDQSKLLKTPLVRIYLDENASNHLYLETIIAKLTPLISKVDAIAFGDISLTDIREFRNLMCEKLNTKAIFPLWNLKSDQYLVAFFESNHQAIVSAIDETKLDRSFLGKLYDREWISRLPDGVHPLGENGEFHTFATYSPFYKMRIPFSKAIAINEGPYLVD
jgi:uncharacterized protein (TIGR00290 family)